MPDTQIKTQSDIPTSSVHLLKYRPEKIEVGMVYHYVKSNLDGTNPARVSIFVATKTHLEVLKIEIGSEVLAYVTADVDWDTFSVDHLAGWHVLPNGTLKSQGVGALSHKNNTFSAWGDNTLIAKVGHYPVHVYNFDFTGFNFIFRHLIEPEKDFEIGVVDYAQNFKAFIYKGTASIAYLERDTYRGVMCRKYLIRGKGMEDQEGFIWVNEEHGHFENFEHPLSDNPSWNSLKMELQSTQTMSVGEWHNFIHTEREQNLRLFRGG